MANETTITVVGNLTADPEFRTTPTNREVVNFTIASTPSTFDRNTNQWKNGDALFLRASAWGELAQNISNSLTKGMRVIAQGNLSQRSYTGNDGSTRTSFELAVTEIGPSLRYATAVVNKTPRPENGGGFNSFASGGNISAPASTGAVNANAVSQQLSPDQIKAGPTGDHIFDSNASNLSEGQNDGADPWIDKGLDKGISESENSANSDDAPF